uniref:dUTP diphosphatase n=1 Tax=viral metagenome TaxID=1070528 RepID=A0A6C0KIV4_9ZZZZ
MRLHILLRRNENNEYDQSIHDLYQGKIDAFEKERAEKNYYLDSGFDIFSPNDIECLPHKTTKIYLGIHAAVYKPYKEPNPFYFTDIGLPYYVYPRSSISKTPLRLANSVGIIDSGYRGQLIAMVDNHSDESYHIKTGDRLFQICSCDLSPFDEIKIVHTLNNTKRGDGGFGSTGK